MLKSKPMTGIWAAFPGRLAISKVGLVFALLVLSSLGAPPASASETASGQFRASRACEAYLSFTKGTNHFAHSGRPADAARLAIVPSGHPMGYQDAFNAFVADVYAAIATGSPPEGLPDFADGLRAVRLTEAVLRSAASRDWVEVTA